MCYEQTRNGVQHVQLPWREKNFERRGIRHVNQNAHAAKCNTWFYYRAKSVHSADYTVARCLSLRLSVTRRYSV